MKPTRTIVDSFNAAIEGIVYVLKTQRNMRLHFIAAVAVIIIASLILENKSDIMILGLAISLVIIAEIFNTAIELIIDTVTDQFHPIIKIIKDVVAGGVLISALNAILIGYIIFVKQPFVEKITDGVNRLRHSDWHVTFIALVLLITIVLCVKAIFQRGTPLRGGMPSGHSASAFAIWTAVSFISNNGFIIVATFVLAFLIAQSRISKVMHTAWEVIIGALTGVTVTTLVFQIFWK